MRDRNSNHVQGAALAALLASYQRQGELLQSVDTLKCCLLFAGVMSRLEEHRPAYTQPIACPSLHVIGIASFHARPIEAVEPCQATSVPCCFCVSTTVSAGLFTHAVLDWQVTVIPLAASQSGWQPASRTRRS